MKIETSKGKTYDVDWIDSPITNPDALYMTMEDGRRLPKIAAEFDSLTEIKRHSDTQGDKTFVGYTKLREISANRTGKVLIVLGKEA